MILVYNNVPLDVYRLLSHSAECVYDESGVDLLYVRHRISVEALIGHNAQAFVFAADPEVGKKPLRVRPQGVFAAESAEAIRHALAQPRKPFALLDFSPGNNGRQQGYETLLFCSGIDAANGPKPVGAVSVLSVHGGSSLYFVSFEIELSVNECPIKLRGGEPEPQPFGLLSVDDIPVLLSNRYTTTTLYDERDATVTYRSSGRSTFRSDALALFQISSPDQFRGDLLPAPADNCKRYLRQLDLAPDGVTIEWVVDDVEQFRVYVDKPTDASGVETGKPIRNVEHIDLVVDKQYSVPSLGKAASRFIEQLQTAQFAVGMSGTGDQAAAAVKGGDGGFWNRLLGLGKGLGRIAGGAAGIAFRGGVISTAITKTIDDDVIPTYSESAVATVQLSSHGRMRDAQALCFALISGALNYGNGRDPRRDGNSNFLALPAQTYTLTYNPVEGWVRASMMVVRSGLMDFNFGNLKASVATMASPIQDTIIGGRMPISLFTLINVFDKLDWADLLELNLWNRIEDLLKDQIKFAVKDKEFEKSLAIGSYTGNLLLTDRDVAVRPLTYDGVSRTAADILVRSAAALLGPCETPTRAITSELAKPARTVDARGNTTTGGNFGRQELLPAKPAYSDGFPLQSLTIAEGLSSLDQILKKWQEDSLTGATVKKGTPAKKKGK